MLGCAPLEPFATRTQVHMHMPHATCTCTCTPRRSGGNASAMDGLKGKRPPRTAGAHLHAPKGGEHRDHGGGELGVRGVRRSQVQHEADSELPLAAAVLLLPDRCDRVAQNVPLDERGDREDFALRRRSGSRQGRGDGRGHAVERGGREAGGGKRVEARSGRWERVRPAIPTKGIYGE